MPEYPQLINAFPDVSQPGMAARLLGSRHANAYPGRYNLLVQIRTTTVHIGFTSRYPSRSSFTDLALDASLRS